MFKLLVLSLHRRFKGEMEIKRFLTILLEGRELLEGGRELEIWGCHYDKSPQYWKKNKTLLFLFLIF